MMPFFEAQLTGRKCWIAIDGPCGTEYIPDDLFDLPEIQRILDSDDDDGDDDGEGTVAKAYGRVRQYCENSTAYAAELIDGYGVRSSAPGSLDCTPWEVYSDAHSALRAYRAEQEECES